MPKIIKPAKGTFTTADITVDSSGRIIAASTGSAGGTFISATGGTITSEGDYNNTAYVYCEEDDEWFYLIPYTNKGMLALITHNTFTIRKAPL